MASLSHFHRPMPHLAIINFVPLPFGQKARRRREQAFMARKFGGLGFWGFRMGLRVAICCTAIVVVKMFCQLTAHLNFSTNLLDYHGSL